MLLYRLDWSLSAKFPTQKETLSMIKCHKCGANQIDSNKKCVFCGADLTNHSAQHFKSKAPSSSNDLFNEQPIDFGNSDDNFPYYQAAQKRHNPTVPIILTVVFIVIFLLIMALFVMQFSQTNTSINSDLQNIPQTESPLIPDTNKILDIEKESPSKTEPINNREKIDIFNLEHSMVLNEIKKNNNIISLNPNDIKKNPNEVLNTLIANLKDNKDCYENSEDFILWFEKDLKTFQKNLKKINYKQLYQAMADKHTNGNTCTNTKPTASWMKGFMPSHTVNPKTNLKEEHESLFCFNNVLYTDNSLLDANLEIYYSIWKETDTRSMFAGLSWNTGGFTSYRFFEPEDAMDSYAMTNLTGSFTSSYVENTEDGRQVLLKSKYENHRPWIYKLLNSDDFQVIYGRFVKNNENGYYFVLSYRKYTLKEMHERCPFVKEEFSKIMREPAPISPPDIRHKDNRPKESKIGLPF